MCRPSSAPFDDAVGFYYTDDIERTHRFWHDTVGLPLALDQGACRIYQISDHGFIGFCTRSEVSADTTNLIITLVTENVDKCVTEMKGRGLKLEQEPAFNPKFRIYHAFFRDPNGYLVEVQRFEDPQWRSFRAQT